MKHPKKTSIRITAVTLIGLIASGGTFALWSNTSDINASVITAGNMDLNAGNTLWYDASQPNGDPIVYENSVLSDFSQRVIDPTQYSITPGDTISSVTPINIQMSGDNLKIETGLNIDGIYSGEFFDSEYVNVRTMIFDTVTDELYSMDGKIELVTPEFVETHGLPEGAIEYNPSRTDSYIVVTAIHFSSDTPDDVLERTQGFIDNTTVYAKQVKGFKAQGQVTPIFIESDFVITSNGLSTTFEWPMMPNVQYYSVQYSVGYGSEVEEITTYENRVVIDKTSEDEIIQLKVQAVDNNDVISDWSEYVYDSPEFERITPTVQTSDYYTVTVEWPVVDGAEGYDIVYKINGEEYTSITVDNFFIIDREFGDDVEVAVNPIMPFGANPNYTFTVIE